MTLWTVVGVDRSEAHLHFRCEFRPKSERRPRAFESIQITFHYQGAPLGLSGTLRPMVRQTALTSPRATGTQEFACWMMIWPLRASHLSTEILAHSRSNECYCCCRGAVVVAAAVAAPLDMCPLSCEDPALIGQVRNWRASPNSRSWRRCRRRLRALRAKMRLLNKTRIKGLYSAGAGPR